MNSEIDDNSIFRITRFYEANHLLLDPKNIDYRQQ